MLQKVEPQEKGVPHAKNLYISNITATNGTNAYVSAGLESSLITNFVFTGCNLSATNMSSFEYTKDWEFNNVKFSMVKLKEVKERSNESNEKDKN